MKRIGLKLAVTAGDDESLQCHLSGIIVRDLSITVSNYRATKSLDEFCKEQDVAGIADVDTRLLTRVLRDTGCINGVICSDASKTDSELVELAKVCICSVGLLDRLPCSRIR